MDALHLVKHSTTKLLSIKQLFGSCGERTKEPQGSSPFVAFSMPQFREGL